MFKSQSINVILRKGEVRSNWPLRATALGGDVAGRPLATYLNITRTINGGALTATVLPMEEQKYES